MPLPVMRMAPKPMRLTVRSPPSVTVPALAAGKSSSCSRHWKDSL